MIRLLVSANVKFPSSLFCQTWFDNQMTSSEISYVESLQMYEEEHLPSFMMVCPLPSSFTHKIPRSVSLVENQCDKAREESKKN